MKNILCILLIFFCMITYSNDGIQFEENRTWQQVLDKAKKDNKFILVDCYTTWCGPCKWMAKEIFPKAEVGTAINPNYISAAFDMEKGEGKILADKFSIRSYPTYIFLNPTGEIVHRGLGSMHAEDFIRLCNDALDSTKQFITLKKKYLSGNRDTGFLINFAYLAADAQDSIADEVFSNYLSTQELVTTSKNMKIIIDLTNTVQSPGFEIIKNNKTKFIDNIGTERYNNIILELVYKEAFMMAKKNKLSKDVFIQTVNKFAPEYLDNLIANFNLNTSKKNSDWKAYILYAEKYSKTTFANDWNTLNEIGYTIFEKFKDKASLQKALKYCLQSVNINNNLYNNSSIAEIYLALKDKLKAKPFAEKALEQAKIAGEDTEEFEKIVKATN